jgi:hypothetical protein
VPTIEGVGRRQFLITASAAAATAAVLGPRVFAAKTTTAPAPRLAVGFVSQAGDEHVFPARDIPFSDGHFIGSGARIAISGASGVPPSPTQRRMVQLQTNFAYLDGAKERLAPFHAWGASRITGDQGPPTRFLVPLPPAQTISLTVVVEDGDPVKTGPRGTGPTVTSLPLLLSVQNNPAALPLARGSYVIVPLSGTDSEPDWSRYQVLLVDGHWALVDGTGRKAAFEHLVVRVDYADA